MIDSLAKVVRTWGKRPWTVFEVPAATSVCRVDQNSVQAGIRDDCLDDERNECLWSQTLPELTRVNIASDGVEPITSVIRVC